MTNNARGAEGPNLLIVGFLKCGTTSLAKYLSDHPDVASPVAKELYYLIDPHSNLVSMQPVIGKLSFGKTGIDGRIPKYADFFSEIFEKKYAMDATPFYYSQQRALKYAENNPDTKIIFMMRSPEKRILSSFRFFQSMYQEYPASSFSEFVDALLGGEEQKKNYRKRIKKAFSVNYSMTSLKWVVTKTISKNGLVPLVESAFFSEPWRSCATILLDLWREFAVFFK